VVQRFRCLRCGFSFSSQSFRVDCGLRKPQLNFPVFLDLVSKVTLRQCARKLECTRRTVERRLDRFGTHLQQLHELECSRLRGKLGGPYLLDELETFEQDRRLQPLTVPVLLHGPSLFVVHHEVAPMAARGGLGEAFERKKAEREARHGKRKGQGRAALAACFRKLGELSPAGTRPIVHTDRKGLYESLLKAQYPGGVRHLRCSSKQKRDTRNPLFAINHLFAMQRDGLSRLVRRTWAHTKKAARLVRHQWVWIAYRNWVRARTNKERGRTPAMFVGLADRPVPLSELLGIEARFRLAHPR
jgi:hypothetical protein